MPNKLHNEWLAGKKALETEVDNFKQGKTRLIAKPVEVLLKGFNKGLGPKLEDVSKAYKAKNDADVKKQAAKALVVAEEYKKMLKAPGGIDEGRGIAYRTANAKLDGVIKSLTALKDKGVGAPDPS